MPLTVGLVSVGADSLFYRINSISSGGEFPVFGGTTTLLWSRLQEDGVVTNTPGPTVVNGAFRQVLFANLEGIGTVPAGAGLTQAQARALFLLDSSGTSIGNDNVPRALTTISPRDANSAWSIDVSTTGITVSAENTTSSQAYLRIQLVHSLWR